jgi:chromate transporter
LVVIVALSIVAAQYGEIGPIRGALFGLQAATVAVVAEALHRIAKRALEGTASYALATAAFVALFFFRVPFPVVILAAALFGACWLARAAGVDDAVEAPASRGSTLRVSIVCVLLWTAPITMLGLGLGTDHVLFRESTFFSKMAMVTFGGAYAVLTYVAQQAVEVYRWLTPDQMVQGLALAETTPGPLILVLSYVGFLAAYRAPAPFTPIAAGLLGASITTWVTFVPCFLWVLVGAPYIERLRNNRRLAAALRAITAAVVGVVLNLSLWFAMHVFFGEVGARTFGPSAMTVPVWDTMRWMAAGVASASALALIGLRVPLLLVLGASALLGALMHA